MVPIAPSHSSQNVESDNDKKERESGVRGGLKQSGIHEFLLGKKVAQRGCAFSKEVRDGKSSGGKNQRRQAKAIVKGISLGKEDTAIEVDMQRGSRKEKKKRMRGVS